MAKRTTFQVTAALILIGVGTATTLGQEIDPSNPYFLAAGVDEANLIVVGTFRVGWFYPWFDGWHYRGALQIEEVLNGNRKPGTQIEFRWKEVYGASCLTCNQTSRIDGQRGIWMLVQKEGRWLFSGTAATWCGWSLPLHVRGAVEKAIRENRTSSVAR